MDLRYTSDTNQGFKSLVHSVFPHSSVIITSFELMFHDCLQSLYILRVNTVNQRWFFWQIQENHCGILKRSLCGPLHREKIRFQISWKDENSESICVYYLLMCFELIHIKQWRLGIRVHWRFLEEKNTGDAKSLPLKDTIAIWHQDGVWHCDLVRSPAVSGQGSFWHAGKKTPSILLCSFGRHTLLMVVVMRWRRHKVLCWSENTFMCMLTWRMITRCSSHETDPQATKSISACLVFVTCSSLLEIVTLPW